MAQPNLLAVLIAGLIPMFVGAVWFSTMGFGVQWMKLVGKTEDQIREESQGKEAQMYGLTFVFSLITSYILATIIIFAESHYGEVGLLGGMLSGFFVWLGFVATIAYQSVTFEFRKPQLYVLNTLYNLVCLVLMGALFGVWR